VSDLGQLDQQVLWHPFTQMAEWTPLVIAGGSGSYVFDSDGNRYLDGVSSLWCTLHGHRHPRLDQALREQVDRIAHTTFLGLTHEPGIRLAAALVEVAPAGLTRVFYSDSGSTAVEIALKQSFQYWQLRGRPSKQRFLRLGDAYHGDTLGAVGVGGIELFHRIFGPLLVRSTAIPTPAGTDGAASLAALEAALVAHADDIAAFVIEPLVQGAAGMLVHPRGYLAAAAALCRRHGVHLIAATLATEEIYSAFLGKVAELKHFFHGHTYTANPLACAVGLASLALLRESTLGNARARIPSMTAALSRIAQLPGVHAVRQCGLMAGIELAAISGRLLGAEVCQRVRAHGVILRPLGDVVVWMPPLTLASDDLELLERATVAAIRETLR
jgi:adenosylmethionine-8-amino-7-oxononanoate aminotransferase